MFSLERNVNEVIITSVGSRATCRAEMRCRPQWPASCSRRNVNPDPTESAVVAMDDFLERLLAFEPTTLPVLSLYLNTTADQHGRAPDLAAYLKREFKRIAATWPASSAERTSFDADAE